MKQWLKNRLRKSLGINELDNFTHKALEHLLGSIEASNKNVALIDGRMRELELALHLMSTKECADYLGVTVTTVKNKIADGKLIARRVGCSWIVTKLELLRYENRVAVEKGSK